MNISTIKDKIKNKTTTLTGALVVNAKADSLNNDIGYYFDIITNHSISIENNITDNYIEDNTAIQDVIAHAPITISLSGSISELVYVPSTNSRFLGQVYKYINKDATNKNGIRDYVVTDKLSALAQLYPPVDNLTQLAKNTIVYIEDSIDRYHKIYKNFTRNINEETRLQKVYSDLKDLRDTNASLIVVTPFGQFINMYIQSINFEQGNENHVGNISITLKELNFASVLYTEADQSVLSRYNKNAQADTENNGKADGMSKDSIIGEGIYNMTHWEPLRFNQ